MKFLIFLSALAGTVWMMIALNAVVDGADPMFAVGCGVTSDALFTIFVLLLCREARR